MSTFIEAVDKMNHAARLVDAATMAISSIEDQNQRKALDALLYEALLQLRSGLAGIEAARAGMKGEKA